MLQLPVLIKAVILILGVTAVSIQQAALLHVSHSTNQWGTEKAEHLTDQIYSKGTHMEALIQREILQEQTAPVDGCGHQNSQQAHHKASQKPSLGNPKLQGKHLWLTTASSVGRIPSCTRWTCSLHPFPPFQRASSGSASQLTWGTHPWATRWAAQGQRCIYARLSLHLVGF